MYNSIANIGQPRAPLEKMLVSLPINTTLHVLTKTRNTTRHVLMLHYEDTAER